jgi:hypothetical protein
VEPTQYHGEKQGINCAIVNKQSLHRGFEFHDQLTNCKQNKEIVYFPIHARVIFTDYSLDKTTKNHILVSKP